MADTKTYLKVPYRDRTIRALPFNGGHLTALTMAKQLRDPARQLNAALRVLNRLIGDDEYEEITNDLVDGEVTVSELIGLLDAIVHATVAYYRAQAEKPAPEPDPGTGGE
jgi:hypothetical protein